MSGLFEGFLRIFLSPLGVFFIGALDSSLIFFLPLAVDSFVIVLSARNPETIWIYPLLAALGSVIGGGFTFWIGKKIGEAGLESFISDRRLEAIRSKVEKKGALALIIPALIPPPFPFTPFLLICGALDLSRKAFFLSLASSRLFRFGVEALLAYYYGEWILSWMKSDLFRVVVGILIALAIAGTIFSAYQLWKSTQHLKHN